jgi:hypothetical protein
VARQSRRCHQVLRWKAGVEGVDAGAAGEPVAARAAAQDVRAVVAGARVVAAASVEGVVAGAAGERVIAVAAAEQVDAAAVERVRSGEAEDQIRAAVAGERVDPPGPTRTVTRSVLVDVPSGTRSVSPAGPLCFAAAATVRLRFSPEPPGVTPELGTSCVLLFASGVSDRFPLACSAADSPGDSPTRPGDARARPARSRSTLA